jgi:hypothetical protein
MFLEDSFQHVGITYFSHLQGNEGSSKFLQIMGTHLQNYAKTHP